MTEKQFYKWSGRKISVPAYYAVVDGQIVIDTEEIIDAVNSQIHDIEVVAESVKL